MADLRIKMYRGLKGLNDFRRLTERSRISRMRGFHGCQEDFDEMFSFHYWQSSTD